MTRYTPTSPLQTGLTLVEVLVAVTLGLMTTLLVGYLFMGSLANYRTLADNARVQETLRFIQDMLGRDLAHAGYPEITPIYTDTKTEFGGVPISGEDGVVSAHSGERKAGTDYLRLSFDGARDCGGKPVASNLVVNEYYVNVGGQLLCVGNGGAREVLAEGVEDLQVIYGIDTDFDLDVDHYTSTPADWSRVISAQVCLLVRSPNDGVAAQAQRYQDCAGTNQVAGDRRLRRTLRFMHQLRNRGA